MFDQKCIIGHMVKTGKGIMGPEAQQKNPEREARILQAAATLIVHYGYDKTTVADIAEEAGISKGAVYLHFESKEALFQTLLEREILAYSREWLELIEADPQGGTLAGMYKNVLIVMRRFPLMQALFRQDRRVLGSYLRTGPANLNFKLAIGKDFIAGMQQVGAIRSDMRPEIVAYIMSMLSYALVSMDDVLPAEAIPPMEEVIEGVALLLDRALSSGDTAGSEAGKQLIRQLTQMGLERMQGKGPTTTGE